MLPKDQRISKKKDVQAVFDRKLSFYNEYFGLKANVNYLGKNRYTVLVGKRLAKLAVDRNKIKRRVKYILRKSDSVKRRFSYDLVILSLKNPLDLEFKELERILETLLDKLK